MASNNLINRHRQAVTFYLNNQGATNQQLANIYSPLPPPRGRPITQINVFLEVKRLPADDENAANYINVLSPSANCGNGYLITQNAGSSTIAANWIIGGGGLNGRFATLLGRTGDLASMNATLKTKHIAINSPDLGSVILEIPSKVNTANAGAPIAMMYSVGPVINSTNFIASDAKKYSDIYQDAILEIVKYNLDPNHPRKITCFRTTLLSSSVYLGILPQYQPNGKWALARLAWKGILQGLNQTINQNFHLSNFLVNNNQYLDTIGQNYVNGKSPNRAFQFFQQYGDNGIDFTQPQQPGVQPQIQPALPVIQPAAHESTPQVPGYVPGSIQKVLVIKQQHPGRFLNAVNLLDQYWSGQKTNQPPLTEAVSIVIYWEENEGFFYVNNPNVTNLISPATQQFLLHHMDQRNVPAVHNRRRIANSDHDALHSTPSWASLLHLMGKMWIRDNQQYLQQLAAPPPPVIQPIQPIIQPTPPVIQPIQPAPIQPPPQPIKVLTYNVFWKAMSGHSDQNVLGGQCGSIPNRCLRNVVNVIDNLANQEGGLDFIAIQEASRTTRPPGKRDPRKEYIKEVSKYLSNQASGMYSQWTNSGSEEMVTFYNVSRFGKSTKLIKGDHRELVNQRTPQGQPIKTGRPFQILFFDNPGKTKLVFINIHTGDRPNLGDNPWEHFKAVIETYSNQLRDYRVVAAGDFNYDLKNKTNINSQIALGGLILNIHPSHLKTYSNKQLDHVIDTQARPTSIRIPPVTSPASDHKPVFAVLAPPPAPQPGVQPGVQPIQPVQPAKVGGRLIYLVPDAATQQKLRQALQQYDQSHINRWGGFHVTIGKTTPASPNISASNLVDFLYNSGKTKSRWVIGPSRKLTLTQSGNLLLVKFQSGFLSNAINLLRNRGWNNLESDFHLSLGNVPFSDTIYVNTHVIPILRKANWEWVAVKRSPTDQIEWYHRKPAHNL